jgi:hypothetical protein
MGERTGYSRGTQGVPAARNCGNGGRLTEHEPEGRIRDKMSRSALTHDLVAAHCEHRCVHAIRARVGQLYSRALERGPVEAGGKQARC